MEKQFIIEKMHCEGCVNRIKNVLKNIKGVIDYNLSLETKELNIKVKKEAILKEVIDKISALGFEVIPK